MKKKDQIYIKRENQGIVLDLIHSYGMISRAEIAKVTKMSATTVSRIVNLLINLNLVRQTNQYTTGVGRKAALLTVNSESIISIGVELDKKIMRVGLIDFEGNIVFTENFIKKTNEKPEHVIMQLKEIIFRMIDEQKLQHDNIIGICIGIPGVINNESGIIKKSTQLGWNNIKFGEMLEEKLGFRVIIDNELKMKAYAESRIGQAKQSEKMVVISFGSGVGSALMIDNEIYRGDSNIAGEIGHTIVNPNGTLCTCGNFGCIQTYVGEYFLMEEASKSSQEVNQVADIVHAAMANEKWAINILERATTYAAIAVNNIVCVNNPDTVILTGSFIHQSSYVRDKIISKCMEQIWEVLKDSFQIKISEMNTSGVLLGAGLFMQKEFLDELNFEEPIV